MLQYRYDTQMLIDGEDLDEDEIRDYITEHFDGDCLLAVGGDGDPVKIHFHTNEPWKLLEEERNYFSSARNEKNLAWWRAQYETEPCFTSINGLGSPEFVEGRRYGQAQNFEQL